MTTSFRKFNAFIEAEYGQEKVPSDALDARLFRAFRACCYETCDNKPNTVGKALNMMRTLVRTAMKDKKLTRYPFEHISIDSEPTEKELLTPEEIEQIAEIELENEDSQTAEVRRWFLFAYYAGGMRFSDVTTLLWKHIREGRSGQMRVCYKMKKTSDSVGVPLVPGAKEILSYYEEEAEEDWVFPIAEGIDPGDAERLHARKTNRNSVANRVLKTLASRAGLDTHVTFHLSRHAAAWKLYQNVGDIYKVSKFLGHSEVEQTQGYIDGFVDESRDEDFLDAMT
jgi:integrase